LFINAKSFCWDKTYCHDGKKLIQRHYWGFKQCRV
jgi:hypothetical protein